MLKIPGKITTYMPSASLIGSGVMAIVFTAMVPEHLFAKTLGDMADSAATDAFQLKNLLSIGFYIIGIIVVGVGLLKVKKSADMPQQSSLAPALTTIVIGALLIMIPIVVDAFIDTTGSSQSTTVSKPRI